MSSLTMQHHLSESNPNFGANKKRRKPYRQRPADANEDSDGNSLNTDTWIDLIQDAPDHEHPDSDSTGQKTIMSNLRKRLKNRRTGGVEFKAKAPRAGIREDIQVEVEELTPEGLGGPNSKYRIFSKQTGAVEDIDKHM